MCNKSKTIWNLTNLEYSVVVQYVLYELLKDPVPFRTSRDVHICRIL